MLLNSMFNKEKVRSCSAIIFSILLVGCASIDGKPLSTSVTALTSESSTKKTKILNYSELLSVAGLLPIPDVGALYHQPTGGGYFNNEELGPFYSIGIVRNAGEDNKKSFRLIGEFVESPNVQEVIAASRSIDDLHEASIRGIGLLIEQSAIGYEIDKLKENKISNKLDEVEVKLLENKLSGLQAKKTKVDERVALVEEKIKKMRRIAQDATSKEGLIVAQWTTNSSGKAGVGVGDDLNDVDSTGQSNGLGANVAATSGKSGLAVLGGLKVSMLFFAEDYMKMLATTKSPIYKGLLKHVGVTTSLMQTKYISYSSNISIEKSIDIQAKAQISKFSGLTSKKILQGIDQAKLTAYLSSSSNLSNKGVLGKIRWYKDDVDFSVNGKEFASMPSYSKSKIDKASEYDNWITLQSVQAQLNSNILNAILSKDGMKLVNEKGK